MYQIIAPAPILVSGPSGCGKTYLIRDLIRYKKDLFSIEPTEVVYYYAIYQEIYNSMPGVEFIQGRPSSLERFQNDEHSLIIIDDAMLDLVNDKVTASLFIRGSHHYGISVIIVSQNIFQQGKVSRTISLNTHYIFMFRSPRDSSIINRIASQIYPGKGGILIEAFQNATQNKLYGYLCIDLSPHLQDDNLRLRCHILPNEECIVYKPL